jgi:hypothetical protein
MEQSSEISSHIYGQIIFDKNVKTTQREKDGLFNKWYLENWVSKYKRMKLDSCTTY